ncbi:MAG TPA: amino acid adenylation domain-containing protein [Bryobacteraceae bacterium]|nr:amino acid adenylation domain-containing protein [Bryobacteraceae bacterium]
MPVDGLLSGAAKLSEEVRPFRLARGGCQGAEGVQTATLGPRALEIVRRLGNGPLGEFTVTIAGIALVLARSFDCTRVVFRIAPQFDSSEGATVAIDVRQSDSVEQYLCLVARRVEEAYETADAPDSSDGIAIQVADARLHVPWARSGSDDLALICRLDDGQIEIAHSARWEDFVVAGLAEHLDTVLSQFGDLDRGISDLDLLTDVEQCHLLEFNPAPSAEPTDTVIRRFEDQVARTPGAIALRFQGQTTTYRELNAKANQLAHYLRECGIGPEQLVGVRLERSDLQVAAVLAILKSGAAFVPIDADYPAARVNYILADTRVPVFLTQSSLLDGGLDYAGHSVELDLDWPHQGEACDNLQPIAKPSSLAYVLYTSGSTGAPKGCQIEHRSLFAYVSWAIATYLPDGVGGFGLYSSLCFDFTITNLLCPLLSGNTLHIYPQSESIESILRHAFQPESGVHVIKLTPSHIRLLEHLDLGPSGIRVVIAGGEELTAHQVGVLHEINPDIAIFNEYGPTEATVGCVVKRVEQDDAPILIGTPIPNASVYVLDRERRLLPVGCTGEIWIGGGGLARGYHQRPDLTDARFVSSPFRAGERIYRSGDLGRWLPSGELQCFGRTDDQVKIRGYRVELGEVESALATHHEIAQAIVTIREDRQQNKRIVAYLISESRPPASDVRRYAAELLPDYMVPADVVYVESYPLTINGKIDRDALPDPMIEHEATPSVDADSLTAAEAVLLQILGEVFPVDRGALDQTFFDLGGDSLVAVQVVARVWERFAVEISIDEVFEAPTLRDLTARFGASPTPESAPGVPVRSIPIVPRTGDLALSFSQQRLWFLAQLEGPNSAYNLVSAVRLDGPLMRSALESAISEIVRRHEILRTTFPAVDGRPVQRIAPFSPVALAERSFEHLPIAEREPGALQLAAMEAAQPFDLANGPLWRLLLLRLDDSIHVLLQVMHHIISDGWSVGVLVRELGEQYRAALNASPQPSADLPLQYADYAAWQRARIESDAGRQQLAWWKDRLDSAPLTLELPADRARPAIQTFRGAGLDFQLNAALVEDLRQIAQSSGASLYMLLLCAFAGVLSRYTQQTDLVLGTPVANRPVPELEPLIGFFVNTLALRLDLSGSPSFREALERTRRIALDAMAHSETPFELVVEALKLDRDLSRSPVFQVMFAFENTPAPPLDLPNVAVRPVRVERGEAKFELTLYLEEAGRELAGTFEYNADLFDAPTIARLREHFERLLHGIAANPDLRLLDIPLLSAEETRTILVEWNDTARHYRDACVHEWFEEQVRRTPNAVAVVYENQELSYAALNARANQLAHRLIRSGVVPDTLVAVAMERSIEMIVTLLAVLKAGGAYVPMDPEYPRERLLYMLQDAAAPVLLTQRHLVSLLPHTKAEVLCVDAESDSLDREADVNPAIALSPHNLAYMIYTSGSTGRPKGAMNEHRGVANRLLWMQDAYRLTSADRVLQKTPFSFDVSVWEFFWPLTAGAQLVFARPGGHRESDYLVRLIGDRGITTIHFVPSMLRAFLEDPGAASCTSLRRVIASGEALAPDLAQKFFRILPAELHNLYGPTECAVDVTSWRCLPGNVARGVPIGRPIANTQIYIVDEALRPVPVGVPGELLIGGAGVGRGYHNDPDLTTRKFIPDLFSGRPEARLYRTGDLARYRHGGEIEFLGRIDHQVKIRGFRIELEEIETTLRRHPSVLDCVVVRQEQPVPRLVAYLSSRGTPVPTNVLASFLRERLPDYMVPSFVSLPSLPLLPNGKIDRKALPQTVARTEPSNDAADPSTPKEEVLAAIWREVLAIDHVGLHDNFFELGGDSILSIQIVARANRAGLRITPKQFFQNQTIAELALVAVDRVPAIGGHEALGRAPLTPIQHWFFEQDLGEIFYFNQSVLLRVPSDVRAELMAQAVRRVYAHHDGLRLRFHAGPDGWSQEVVDMGDEPIFRSDDLSGLAPAEVVPAMAAIASEAERAIDLTRGPLVQFRLMHLRNEPARLFVVIHHLAVDGVSWRILLEDLYTVYHQLERGESVELPPKTIAFRDWAAELQSVAETPEIVAEAAYWRRLAENPPASVPVDREPVENGNAVADAAAVSVTLNEAETLSLLQEVPQAYNTRINDVLLTALFLALHQSTGAERFLVDLEGHGRREFRDGIDLSRTTGWFTTIAPLLLEGSAGASLAEHLKSIKEQIRHVPSDGFGFMVLKYLSPDPELRSALRACPRAQVMFNYLGRIDRALPERCTWTVAPEAIGNERGPSVQRTHLFEIIAAVSGGRLQVDWVYGSRIHDRARVEGLAAAFQEQLRALIRHCCTPGSRGFTPADFPQANLSQKSLDRVLQRLGSRRESVADIYECSPMQQGLLFHSLYELNAAEYFEQLSCSIRGPLSLAAFHTAWQRVVDRHAVLRTGFYWQDLEHPVQIVFRSAELPWDVLDWRGLTPEERSGSLEAFLHADRQRGFDFDRPPLVRCTLIREEDESFRFCWSHHHILLDGWSAAILMKDVFAEYDAAARGVPSASSPPRPYRAYIEWLQAQDRDKAETYWRRSLAGFYAPTPLPEDRPQTGEEAVKKDALLLLPEEFSTLVKETARRHRLTLNVVFRGIWGILLGRHSGNSEVAFGVTLSGRPPLLEGIESMVGLFINTLPAVLRLDPYQSMLDYLAEIQSGQAELDQFSYSSLAEVQRWSEMPPGAWLFQSLLVFENYPLDNSLGERSGDLRIEDVRTFDHTNYPLTLTVAPENAIAVRLSYDSRHFQPGTVERMLGHIRTVLEGFVENPARPLGRIPMLSPAERQQLLVDFNRTDVAFDPDQTYLHQFERGAQSDPSRVVVQFENRTRQWGELNAQANRMARCLLRRAPLRADDLVAVVSHRSDRMVEAILAIWKCGAAYVPVDPDYPASRIRSMVEQSQARLIVTDSGVLSSDLRVELESLAPVVELDTLAAEMSIEPASNLSHVVKGRDVAYVIFTSGSTGRPKGAMIEHAGMMNHLLAKVDELALTPESVIAQNASHCFDISVWQFFAAPLVGGRTAIYGDEIVLDADAFMEAVDRDGVTILEIVPSYLGILLERMEGKPSVLSGLKWLLVTGETLSAPLVERWFRLRPGIVMVNAYGPTEAGDDVTHHFMNMAPEERVVPVGKPLRNLRIYVVDEQMNLCPLGVRGEVCVSGIGVGRGYLGESERTAAVFVEDPFRPERGVRMYRSGDVGSYAPDGTLQLFGRKDHQVKIRGHRIELGEIECVLEDHPDVDRAVVVVSEERRRGQWLVACVTARTGSAAAPETLRSFLAGRLPEHMIPSAYVVLDEFPLTRNGKIDRQVLGQAGLEGVSGERAHVPPRTSTQRKLAAIWQEVLGHPRIGITEDYFELGGHSLLAVRLMSRVEAEFGLRLPLAQLFQHPTIEQLAATLESEPSALAWDELAPIRAGGTHPPVFLVPGAGGNVIYFRALASHLDASYPVFGLQAVGLDGVSDPLSTVEEIATRHIAAIQRANPAGPYHLAGHSFGAAVGYEMCRQLLQQGHQATLAVLDAPAPILSRDPRWDEWDDPKWLAAIAHEIGIFLGSSLGVTAEDLAPLDPEARLNFIVERIRAGESWLAGGDANQLRAYLRIYKANFQTVYQPQPDPLPIPIVLFRTHETSPGDMAPSPEVASLFAEASWGWQRFSSHPVEVVDVPGDHLGMLLEPGAGILAAHLNGWLQKESYGFRAGA